MSQVPQIAPLPPAPRRSDAPEDFSAKADALAAAQPGFVSQANAQAEFTNSRATAAASSASAALSHANKSKEWAEAALEVEPGQFSSKHYALKSSESAVSSAESAALAESKAAEAAASAASADLSSSSALSSSLNAATSASEAAASAALVEAAMQDIAGGPVASVAGFTGVVSKSQLGTAGFMTDETLPTATPAEMQAGTVTDLRAMSPSLVAQAIGALAGSKLVRSARTSNVQLTAADNGKFIDITSGTFTQTFAACSAMGNGWWCYIRNSGTGDVTLDPNASEQIDGLTSYIMYPGEVRLVQCDGVALRTVVLNSFYKVFTASGTFIRPPGYAVFEGLMWGGGGSGGKGGTGGTASGGGGGACVPFVLGAKNFPTSVGVSIGAGGGGPWGASAGNAGGMSALGSLVYAHGGGAGFFTTNANDFPGGGGGGAFSAGGNATISFSSTGGAPAIAVFGGASGQATSTSGESSAYGGGAGGSGRSTLNGGPGGSSIYGGGGGGGVGNTTVATSGGYSRFGGKGGNSHRTESAEDGAAPGGGGGATVSGQKAGDGARGELRIWGII